MTPFLHRSLFIFCHGLINENEVQFFYIMYFVSLSSSFLTQSDGNMQVAKLMSVFGELCIEECKEGSPQVRDGAA